MEQTSLNLVAIAVFVMTLSALLGPIFNISPFIPAAATFTILGLATVDSFSWGGKGLTLFLDLFTHAEERQRIIHHEAGHFLAAYCLGIPVTGYTLTAWETFKQGEEAGMGGVQFDFSLLSDQEKISKNPLIIERTFTVLMAGIAAENIIYEKAEGGKEDKQNLREIMKILDIPVHLYPQKESWALLQAKNLLLRHQTSYKALVKIMEKRASVEECQTLIQHTMINDAK
ncbi:conserved hypothetical protein [Crocosphaera subtropica ATCC 51142]|uniref:ATP-dependent Zn protease n=1 Tax=Crocosphaera subtropica (strain ATCC 51142 / BH68) TaxID=43989 RepID=B1WZW2_CROS5|nr:hypothetical protein [Crocosphaera subtropica]ACB52861.1 conserved hypothetical protein [Crocosphaera subtropica ATCC 51142]